MHGERIKTAIIFSSWLEMTFTAAAFDLHLASKWCSVMYVKSFQTLHQRAAQEKWTDRHSTAHQNPCLGGGGACLDIHIRSVNTNLFKLHGCQMLTSRVAKKKRQVSFFPLRNNVIPCICLSVLWHIHGPILVTRFSERRKSDHGYVITPSDIYMKWRYSLKGRMIRVWR